MQNKKRRAINIVWMLFAIYFITMAWLLFGRTQFGIGKSYWVAIQHNVNLTPFRTIKDFWNVVRFYSNSDLLHHAFVNLVGNVVAFIPMGIFVPVLFHRSRKLLTFIPYTAPWIVGIECIQLFTLRGIFDIDDIILNLLGGVIGFMIFTAWQWIKNNHKHK